MNSSTLLALIVNQLMFRHDFYHIVYGPKREMWFTAEMISAISVAESTSLNVGRRIFGEETYKTISSHLSSPIKIPKPDKGKRPDITAISLRPLISVDYIIEAKLVNDYNPQTLGTRGDNHLESQLDRASRLFPDARIFGVIFVIHDTCRPHFGISSETYFTNMTTVIQRKINMAKYKWSDPLGVIPITQLKNRRPLGGPFMNFVSLGIGIVEPLAQGT